MRLFFYTVSGLSFFSVFFFHLVFGYSLEILRYIIPLFLLGVYDLYSSHNVLRNYPIVGHLRFIFEFIRPEIQQYFIATNLSGRPFNRELRSLVYARAQNKTDTHAFGTEQDITKTGYHFAQHALSVKEVDPLESSHLQIGNGDQVTPYFASRINISAMSFGSLSQNAVLSLNWAAKLGNFAQNTGEGGISRYHLQYGGDIIWQIGTGYFGCRKPSGEFDIEKFAEQAAQPGVKMIEIKLSQGAKPSHGGVLPASKITAEISDIRGISENQDCISPPAHSAFSTPITLLQFLEKLRQVSQKPVGFKLCIGKHTEFMGICKAMLSTHILPDFITVDGAEGGTGAAPLEFTNRLGMSINESIAFVHSCLKGIGVRDSIKIIASGKVITGFDVVTKIALGADMVNLARGFMFSIGCIQALRCHTNTCPTGVATQSAQRAKGISVQEKAQQAKQYQAATMESFLSLLGAMGVAHPSQLHPGLIYARLSEGHSDSLACIFDYITEDKALLHNKKISSFFEIAWKKSKAECF